MTVLQNDCILPCYGFKTKLKLGMYVRSSKKVFKLVKKIVFENSV